MRKAIVISIGTFVLGLVIGAAVAVRGQAPTTGKFTMQTDTAGHVLSTTRPEPHVLKSEDLSFRMSGRNGKRVVGTLMARVNGAWVEVQLAQQDSFAVQK
jgi:hypothetical protein